MRLLRLPGVYRPRGDTELLRQALCAVSVPPGARMLDVCTGTGLIALTGARLGAAEVHAVDISARAVLTARCNGWLHRAPVRAHRADLLPRAAGRFDLVTANPPYVPYVPSCGRGGTRRTRTVDAGPDGRRYLDRLCEAAPRLLAPDGVLLVVHSALCGTERTVDLLHKAGLKAAVVARRVQPFGSVLHERAAWLEEQGLITPAERRSAHDELVVIRGDLPTR